MNKNKNRGREEKKRKAAQRILTRWVIIGGLLLLVIAGIWLVFSGRDSANQNAEPISRLNTDDFHSLAFSLTEPETIYFGHHGGLMVSNNGGEDWKKTSLNGVDAMALGLPGSNPQIMYAAGHDVFYKSIDAGQTWESVSTNLPGTDIHGFTVDSENENRVFANVAGFGIFGSQDGGEAWEALSTTAPPSTFNLTMGENSEALYAAAGQAGLWKSADGGKTWLVVSQTPDEGAIAVVYVRENNRLFISTAGAAGGLYFSDDNGGTWSQLGLNGVFMAIAVSPKDTSHIVIVNDQGEVFSSRDSGVTWQ